ncbi:MAG: glycosyltransferase, partial [Acidobacteria bacterium]|nr:glycosyltransferase [Acidobacteriota bacterium]
LHVDQANEVLGRLVAEAGPEPIVHLLGLRRDMPRVTAALDVAALSSAGQESLPLVVGEAMSCGVPCVVTDVGDASYLVGDTGVVVPPRDPDAMAAAWAALMAEGTDAREARGRAARERIARHFGLDAVARQYEDFYASLVSRSRSRARSNTTVASAE